MLGGPAGTKGLEIVANNSFFGGIKELGIIINNFCTRKCSFCIYGHSPKPKTELDLVLFKKTIQKMPSLECIAIIGKEPLLSKKILNEVIALAKSRNLKCGFITNGDKLNYCELLSAPDYIDISIHDANMDEVINSMINFKKTSTLTLCYVLTSKNVKDITRSMVKYMPQINRAVLSILVTDNTSEMLSFEVLNTALSKIKNIANRHPD